MTHWLIDTLHSIVSGLEEKLVERHLGYFRDHAFESAQEKGLEKVITTVRIIIVKGKKKINIRVKISRVSLAESMLIYPK